MKKIFSTSPVPNNIDAVVLFVRIAIAALMLTHGLPKLSQLLSNDSIQFPPIMGMSPALPLLLTVFAEVFCSILILVGFATRLATIPLIITMLVAVLFIHGADPFAKKEMALHFLLVYALLFVTGSGKYSVDQLIQRRQLSAAKAAYKMR